MKHCYNAHVIQCMKFNNHLNKNQSQNINKNSRILKNFNQFQKTPKVRSKIMNMHDKDEESIILEEKQGS